MRCTTCLTCVVLGLLCGSGNRPLSGQDVRALQPHAAEWERLAAAEDARAATPAQLQVLLDALRSPHAELRAIAVRGLGRLERNDLAQHITPLLHDPAADVRAMAAHALGQAVVAGDPTAARAALSAALNGERNAYALSAIAETLGRLRNPDAETARATAALLSSRLTGEPVAALGALRGLYMLGRQQTGRTAVALAAPTLRPLTTYSSPNDVTAQRIRRTAVLTLAAVGAHDSALIEAVLADDDPFVRREAAAALNTLSDTAASRRVLMERVLADPAGTVRYEGVRGYARRFASRDGCDPLRAATRDRSEHVVLLAIDLLRVACPRDASVTLRLDSLARSVDPRRWHAAAHALVALSERDPARTRALLPRFATHSSLFARTYAATAAGIVRDTTALLRFAGDAHPNVRTVAVEGLLRVLGRRADSVFVAQLALDDSQLLKAAAAALDSIKFAAATPVLLDALDRLTAQRRETSRDARIALLTALRALGTPASTPRIEHYLKDFDPVVADSAANVLQAWTGSRPVPQPTAPPATPLPTYAQAAQLAETTFVFEMENGATFDVRLFPIAAPTNAARFARLARAGYFNGLTFHRIAPNFVVQGGSPGANEYAGDGPFTRDELGMPNWRGTVGLSTRGRDTGDAQIYINMIDNVRLDHDYTIYGEIVRGIEVVDALLEGAVIRRVTERRDAR